MRVEEDGESPTLVLGPMAHGPRRNNPVGRLPVCLVSAIMLGATLICAVLMAITSALGISERRPLNRQARTRNRTSKILSKKREHSVETVEYRLIEQFRISLSQAPLLCMQFHAARDRALLMLPTCPTARIVEKKINRELGYDEGGLPKN